MIKRELLLERDYSLFDNWDALRPTESSVMHPQLDTISFRKHAAEGITLGCAA